MLTLKSFQAQCDLSSHLSSAKPLIHLDLKPNFTSNYRRLKAHHILRHSFFVPTDAKWMYVQQAYQTGGREPYVTRFNIGHPQNCSE